MTFTVTRHKNPVVSFIDDFIMSVMSIGYKDIFGFGMMMIGIVAIWKPAGSILLADTSLGLSPLVHGIWYAASGWLLSKHGHKHAIYRFVYTIPLLVYIFLTMAWIYSNWDRANLVVLVQYIMLYAAIIKLVAIRDD